MEQGYTHKYPHPAVTADCVVFGFDGRNLKILLIERGYDPYKGCWAFPGGFMNIDETAEQCAKRELKEETGLDIANIEQLYTFTDVNRDPRERVITVAYYGFVKLAEVKGSDDAARAQWFALNDIPRLAFDHDKILSMAIQTLRNKAIAKQISDSIVKDFTKTEQQKILDMISEQKSERIAPDFIRSLEKNEIFVKKSPDDIRRNGRKNGALFRVRDVIQIAHQCTMQEREKQPASDAGKKKKEIVTTCSRD